LESKDGGLLPVSQKGIKVMGSIFQFVHMFAVQCIKVMHYLLSPLNAKLMIIVFIRSVIKKGKIVRMLN
jgi:hypothetical protein